MACIDEPESQQVKHYGQIFITSFCSSHLFVSWVLFGSDCSPAVEQVARKHEVMSSKPIGFRTPFIFLSFHLSAFIRSYFTDFPGINLLLKTSFTITKFVKSIIFLKFQSKVVRRRTDPKSENEPVVTDNNRVKRVLKRRPVDQAHGGNLTTARDGRCELRIYFCFPT